MTESNNFVVGRPIRPTGLQLSNAKESMKMCLQIIETHSTERAEHSTGQLIDLLNSSDSREFLHEKLEAARITVESILSHLRNLSQQIARTKEKANNKLSELERLLCSSLYESLKCMRGTVLVLEDRGSSDHEIEEIRKLISESDALDVSAVADVVLTPTSVYFVLTKASAILEDASLSDVEKIKKLWDGMTEDESHETFGDDAEENMRNKGHGGKVLEDFNNGVERCKIGVEDLLSSVHDNIRGLKEKLTTAKSNTFNHIAAPVARYGIGAVGFLKNFPSFVANVVTGGNCDPAAFSRTGFDSMDDKADQGRRFQKRKRPAWFEDTENFIFQFIRGNKTERELRGFIEEEELEADLEDIRYSLSEWISSTRGSVNRWRIPMERWDWEIPKEIPMINKEGVIAEANRTWAFTKALLLEDEAEIDLHSQLLNEAISKALAAGNGVAPVISLGRMPDGGQQLHLRFICGQTADVGEIKSLVERIAEWTDGRVSDVRRTKENEVEFQIIFNGNQEENLRSFMQQLVTKMAELADLHVRIAMLGNFDITSGSRLTNPAFNRTYGDGWKAPGFMPTIDFGHLVYSGEKYFCPNGWRRISINVASSAAEFDRKYGGWHVAYHGTKHELSATILTSGFIPKPGAYSDRKNVVYFTPSIAYASHPRYSDVYQITDSSGKIKYVQMILQVRVNPKKIWKKEGGTLNGAFAPENSYYRADRDGVPADPNFTHNRNLEWLVRPTHGRSGFDMFRDAFVVYGIMIRDSETDPRTHPENAWWAKT